ncbi:hypothetical protein XAB3213_3360041 [Xanthomonas citri pv. bilvae]|nr:hypothetical protein XAB3213_3360041 [Xanthomonas citri pv. bilvae]
MPQLRFFATLDLIVSNPGPSLHCRTRGRMMPARCRQRRSEAGLDGLLTHAIDAAHVVEVETADGHDPARAIFSGAASRPPQPIGA